MYKFAFTYLVKQDKKTWNELEVSLKLLHKNILSKLICNYKIIIFCEGEAIKAVKDLADYLIKKDKINLIFKKISLIKYVKRNVKDKYIKEFPHAADCTSITSLGYRDMCKFFAFDVFFDKCLDEVEYFVRLDTDSFFIYTNKEFIKNLEILKSEYGYIANTIQAEDKAVSLGFGKCIYNFCKKNHSILFQDRNFIKLCQEATLKPKIFYTNFEIIKIKWARSNKHKKIMGHIIKSKGIYNYRWGDALIRYYVVNLLLASQKSLKGCLYKHSGLYDSRNPIQVFLMKCYSKFRGRLYKNNYENKLSKLDKLFLGI
tara:strand:+ start:215 stop:1159 length:945 start_codon:yes stop_codon:yes gene_type:complete